MTVLITALSGSTAANQERIGHPLNTAQIAELITPSVVTITSAGGFGSGVIVDASGVLVTIIHVVQGETELSVKLVNGDIYDDVSVIDVDERRDLVLPKIKGFNLAAAKQRVLDGS